MSIRPVFLTPVMGPVRVIVSFRAALSKFKVQPVKSSFTPRYCSTAALTAAATSDSSGSGSCISISAEAFLPSVRMYAYTVVARLKASRNSSICRLGSLS